MIEKTLETAFGQGNQVLLTDIETTGLSPENDLLLEIGGVVAHSNTAQVADSTRIIIRSAIAILWARQTLEISRSNAAALDIPQAMHLKSGLVEEIAFNDPQTPDTVFVTNKDEADAAYAEFIKRNGMVGKPLVGASVGSLDRPFIRLHLPLVNGLLSHRNVDTSALLEAVALFASEESVDGVRAAAADIEEASGTTAHRSTDDCLYALNRLRHLMVLLGITEVPWCG